MKKKMHPALFSHPSPFAEMTSHPKYFGGSIMLFGIQIEFDWDKKEKSWMVEALHTISDDEMTNFLHELYNVVPEAFSDEIEVAFGDMGLVGPGHVFYDIDGVKFITSSMENIALEVGSKGPTGDLRKFDPDEMVYIYRDEE